MFDVSVPTALICIWLFLVKKGTNYSISLKVVMPPFCCYIQEEVLDLSIWCLPQK